jgi:hypothetical protein
MSAQRFTAKLVARKAGAIGAFYPVTLEFRVEGAPRDLGEEERTEAAIKAAAQMGWETNHVEAVTVR